MIVEHRPILEGIISAMNRSDFTLYDRYFTEDFVDEYPQSGEIVRGPANARWIIENYPGGESVSRSLDPHALHLQANDDVRVLAPTFTIVRLEGRGNEGTVAFRARYPDNLIWWIIVLYQLRGDRICRSTTFFAPEFPPPQWRADHVERMPGR